jgi:SPP1 family predicted phage head-tail adaptor
MQHRATVQKLSATVDGSGHLDENTAANWVDVGKRWCQITTRGSREFFRGVEVAAEITHQITMRSDRDSRRYTEKNRLVFRDMDDKTLNISGPPVDVDEQGERLQFAAIEVRNG